MSTDLTHLRTGMIATVTLDDGTVTPPAEVRNERGVGLYVGPILVRLPNGLAAPGVASVTIENDDDPEVEALARHITAAFAENEWAAMTPESRRNCRVAAGNLIAEGWRRNQPETIEIMRDCFDDISDDNLEQVAEQPDAAPVSLVMSVASRRARKALELRHAARETTGQGQDDDGKDTLVTHSPDAFRFINQDAARLIGAFRRASRGDDAE